MSRSLWNIARSYRKEPISKKRIFYTSVEGNFVEPEFYDRIASVLEVRPVIPRAYSVIESNEKPFTENGNPITRFEAHWWRRYRIASRTAKKFDRQKNPRDLDSRWSQFREMYAIDPEAAIKSHSFGCYQIMGFNHIACGFEQPAAFLNAMKTLSGQGKCFINFVKASKRLHRAMQVEDIHAMSLHYNGPRYKQNRYHIKLDKLVNGGTDAWS